MHPSTIDGVWTRHTSVDKACSCSLPLLALDPQNPIHLNISISDSMSAGSSEPFKNYTSCVASLSALLVQQAPPPPSDLSAQSPDAPWLTLQLPSSQHPATRRTSSPKPNRQLPPPGKSGTTPSSSSPRTPRTTTRPRSTVFRKKLRGSRRTSKLCRTSAEICRSQERAVADPATGAELGRRAEDGSTKVGLRESRQSYRMA